MEAAGFAYAAGVTDAWRLMESRNPADRVAMLAVAVATVKARAEIERQARRR